MDNLDFLDGGEPPIAEAQPQETATPEPVEQPQAEQQAEASQEQPDTERAERPRGPDGKFAKREEPVMVPLQALHETRDEVKALKAQLETLQKPAAAPEAPQVPDIFENPEGYQAHIQNQLNERLTNVTLNMSEATARRTLGDEMVAAAQEWGKQALPASPAFAQAFYSNPDPYGFLVDQFKQQTLLARVAADPKELEAFLTWQQQGQAQQPAQATPQTMSMPTGSIASATSAGGVSHAAIGPGVAFGNFIK
jgi:hypothetical protein